MLVKSLKRRSWEEINNSNANSALSVKIGVMNTINSNSGLIDAIIFVP